MTIKVGNSKNASNHWGIRDDSVSRDHLEVTKIDDDTLLIKDLNSTNGTFIDGIEIIQSTLQRNQNIRIGYQEYTGQEFFDRVFRYFLNPRTLWTQEFSSLETEFNKYEKKKEKLNQIYQNKINIMRGIIMTIIMALFLTFGDKLGITGEYRIFISIVGGIMVGMVIPYLIPKESISDELLNLRNEYSKILVCPRCKRDLSGASYKHWQSQRRCTCDAIWCQ